MNEPVSRPGDFVDVVPTRRERRWLRYVKWAVAALVLAVVALGVMVWRSYSRIERFDADGAGQSIASFGADGSAAEPGGVPAAPLPTFVATESAEDQPTPTFAERSFADGVDSEPVPTTIPLPEVDDSGVDTYLVFSTGTTGITDEEALAIGVSDPDQRGADTLTDVVMVVMVSKQTDALTVLSIPRDTWLGHHQRRINTEFATDGVGALAEEVEYLTGLDLDHMIRIDMMGFVRLTDALGGVEMGFDAPLRDLPTGLMLDAGLNRIDGPTALALVRARHVEVEREGEWVADPSSDFGRIRRQQQFLAALMNAAWGFDIVTKAPAVMSAVERHVTIDADLSLGDMVELARRLRASGSSLSGHRVPGEVGWAGPASVVFVDPHEARATTIELIQQLG